MKRPDFLSRRNFLKGLGGVTVALPFLESFGAPPAAAQAGGSRLVVFFECNGVNMAEFFPSTPYGALTAASFTGRSTEPLAPYADKLLIPRGMHMVPRGFGWDPGGGDDHAKGMGCKLTATPLAEGGDSYATGISLDQYVASAVNPPGRDPMTLLVGRQNGGVLGHISYRGDNQPVTGDNNPWLVYQDFMGVADAGDEAQDRVLTRRQSVLDLVRGEMQALQSQGLSRADYDKLEMHYTSIREIEQAAADAGLISCNLDAGVEAELQGLDPNTIANDSEFTTVGRLQMDVMALALACGHTRVATLQWGGGAGGPIFRWEGINHDYNHHKISHGSTTDSGGEGSLVGYEQMLFDIDNWFAKQYVYLLDRLSAYSEGDGTVLDNSAVVWANELSDGREHNFMDLPIIIAGGASGYLKTGEYIKVTAQQNTKNDQDAPHNKLLTTLANACGVPTDNFGTYGEPGQFDELLA
ncbi:MAG: DUF1552 domain-containing protein [Myxococcales bacterium]|nr:DUF1552 domain-containing protein [Myxococcales bacterium]